MAKLSFIPSKSKLTIADLKLGQLATITDKKYPAERGCIVLKIDDRIVNLNTNLSWINLSQIECELLNKGESVILTQI